MLQCSGNGRAFFPSKPSGTPWTVGAAGCPGVNNIKTIKRLAFTAVETDARIMSHGYRLSPPGANGDPSQPSVQEMSVKSWINAPNPDDAVMGKSAGNASRNGANKVPAPSMPGRSTSVVISILRSGRRT